MRNAHIVLSKSPYLTATIKTHPDGEATIHMSYWGAKPTLWRHLLDVLGRFGPKAAECFNPKRALDFRRNLVAFMMAGEQKPLPCKHQARELGGQSLTAELTFNVYEVWSAYYQLSKKVTSLDDLHPEVRISHFLQMTDLLRICRRVRDEACLHSRQKDPGIATQLPHDHYWSILCTMDRVKLEAALAENKKTPQVKTQSRLLTTSFEHPRGLLGLQCEQCGHAIGYDYRSHLALTSYSEEVLHQLECVFRYTHPDYADDFVNHLLNLEAALWHWKGSIVATEAYELYFPAKENEDAGA